MPNVDEINLFLIDVDLNQSFFVPTRLLARPKNHSGRRMIKYFFHVDACGYETKDREGTPLVDMASAMQAAMRLAWKVMAAEVAEGRLCLSCRVVIENGENGDRTIVPFREALRLTGV